MKLLYCGHCGDIVRLFPEKRSCRCGKSWGYYEEDNATTVQTYPGLSLGIANPDFETALNTFVDNPRYFSPALAMRCWVNPISEADIKFVPGEDVAVAQDEASTGGMFVPGEDAAAIAQDEAPVTAEESQSEQISDEEKLGRAEREGD